MRNKLYVSLFLTIYWSFFLSLDISIFCLSILFVYLSISGNISRDESIPCLRMLYIFIYIYLFTYLSIPTIYLKGRLCGRFGDGPRDEPVDLPRAQLRRQEEQEDDPQGDIRQDAAQTQG